MQYILSTIILSSIYRMCVHVHTVCSSSLSQSTGTRYQVPGTRYLVVAIRFTGPNHIILGRKLSVDRFIESMTIARRPYRNAITRTNTSAGSGIGIGTAVSVQVATTNGFPNTTNNSTGNNKKENDKLSTQNCIIPYTICVIVYLYDQAIRRRCNNCK
jgi:hypothetical protein